MATGGKDVQQVEANVSSIIEPDGEIIEAPQLPGDSAFLFDAANAISKFDKQVELEKQLSDLQKTLADIENKVSVQQQSVDMSAQYVTKAEFDELKAELQKVKEQPVQIASVPAAYAPAATTPSNDDMPEFFVTAMKMQNEEGTSMRKGKVTGRTNTSCKYVLIADNYGNNRETALYLNIHRQSNGRLVLNYAVSRNGEQQRIGSKWSVQKSKTAADGELERILKGEPHVIPDPEELLVKDSPAIEVRESPAQQTAPTPRTLHRCVSYLANAVGVMPFRGAVARPSPLGPNREPEVNSMPPPPPVVSLRRSPRHQETTTTNDGDFTFSVAPVPDDSPASNTRRRSIGRGIPTFLR